MPGFILLFFLDLPHPFHGVQGFVDGWCWHCWPCGWFRPAEGGLRGRDVRLLNNVVNVFVFYHSNFIVATLQCKQLCSCNFAVQHTHTQMMMMMIMVILLLSQINGITTWMKRTDPKGPATGGIWGSSTINICWMWDGLQLYCPAADRVWSRGECQETWSPLQRAFSKKSHAKKSNHRWKK